MAYWLMKTEPDTFSIDDLKSAQNQCASWEGVRNYQARNFMMQMKESDQVFIYHSSCKEIGIAGIASVVKNAYPDPTALEPKSPYFDPKSSITQPRWFMVDVKWEKSFKNVITLKELKADSDLQQMHLVKKGSRLSVMPVTSDEFKHILKKYS